jgi:hypothetical protein
MRSVRKPLPEGFPSHLFRLIHVKDPSGDSNAIDAFNALFGAIQIRQGLPASTPSVSRDRVSRAISLARARGTAARVLWHALLS